MPLTLTGCRSSGGFLEANSECRRVPWLAVVMCVKSIIALDLVGATLTRSSWYNVAGPLAPAVRNLRAITSACGAQGAFVTGGWKGA